jgi:hypothetical protein
VAKTLRVMSYNILFGGVGESPAGGGADRTLLLVA